MSMKHSKPHFQLARVQNDGTREEEEIAFYQLAAQLNAGQDLKLTRRGLLTLSALSGAALLAACTAPRTDSSAVVQTPPSSLGAATSTSLPTTTSPATDTRAPTATRTDTSTPTHSSTPTRTPTETSTPTETPSRTPTRTATRTQTHTRAPTNKPRPTNTAAPPAAVEQLMGTVLKTGFSDVELKTGPGTLYSRVTTAGNGEPLILIARTADSKWILCIARDGGQGWVPIENIQVEGAVPVTALRVETNIPPTPLPARPSAVPGPRPPFPGDGSYCTCNKVCVCIPVYY